MVVLFAYLVIVPIVTLLHDAVEVQFGDARRAGSEVGTWTFYYLNRTLASPIAEILFWKPLVHTLSVATGVILISLSIGVPLAWLLSRSDMYGRRWFATALIIPYMLPSWTFALAWRTLFRNRTVGGQQGWLESLGFAPPDWLAYGQVPITIILALHYAPFVILLLGNALRSFDSQLEESARILGARSGTVALANHISAHAARPVVGYYPHLCQVHWRIRGKLPFGFTRGLQCPRNITLSQHFIQAERRRSSSGRSNYVDRNHFTADRRPTCPRVAEICDRWGKGRHEPQLSAGGVQVAGVSLRSADLSDFLLDFRCLSWCCRPSCGFLQTFPLTTSRSIIGLARNLETVALRTGIPLTPDLWAAAWNTLRIVGLASLCSGLLGLLVGYVVVRSRVRWISSFLRHVTFFPYLVPGIAFAVAYLSLFAVQRGPIPALYGTGLILILALTCRPDALLVKSWHLRNDATRKRPGGSCTDHRRGVAAPHVERRNSNPEGCARDRDVVALHFRNQGIELVCGSRSSKHRCVDNVPPCD